MGLVGVGLVGGCGGIHRAKANAGRIEDPVCAAEEYDLFCCGVDHDEVAMAPYIFRRVARVSMIA